jgi:lambda family phage portal protein
MSNQMQLALGGACEGAERYSRELAGWRPSVRSVDASILFDKPFNDARGREMGREDGYVSGAESIYRDSVIGSCYRLNAAPDWKVLGATEAWADEFQQAAESLFSLYAESENSWIDASRHDTLTGLLRTAIGGYVSTGEVLASCEWLRSNLRPYSTAIQLIDTDRLSNPRGAMNTAYIRGGIERDIFGAPQAYHIRDGYPNDPFGYNLKVFDWRRVPARKPWGRAMMIHVYERFRPDQTRGISSMVSVLKQMKMTQRFQDVVLQNAVVNATYAATIESELPRDLVMEVLGTDDKDLATRNQAYLGAIAGWSEHAKGLVLDGVKIPHLYPGTKMKLQPAGTNGGIGTGFEESLLRHSASALGLSYEEFSRDFSKTNYSSARAAMTNTWKYMQSRKKMVSDRLATQIYWLWLEEAINAGDLPTFPSADFYDGQNKEAYGKCSWIGAARGQIDELKETQASVMKIAAGLSTLEAEGARLGSDWRELIAQRSREQKLALKLGVNLDLSTQKPSMTPTGEETAEVTEDKTNADPGAPSAK